MNALDDVDVDKFDFGANWARFVSTITETRINEAMASIQYLTRRHDLKNLRVLDIGAGSGLFSLAFHRLGAEVVSFDANERAVDCVRTVKARYVSGSAGWTVRSGSVLDEIFLTSLGTFDLVYAWGVLHHTGSLWTAMDRAISVLRSDGELYVALYNHQPIWSPIWTAIKRWYGRVPIRLRPAYVVAIMLPREALIVAKNLYRPRFYWRSWRRSGRGMDKWTDWVDWVGGYPFETATARQVEAFAAFHSARIFVRRHCGSGHGCNEYLISRKTSEPI